MVKITSEDPLTVEVDGSPATVHTHSYTQDENARTAKYVVTGGRNVVIVAQVDFDPSTLPPS